MTSPAIQSQGTKFYVGDNGSPDNYAAIPGIRTIGGPSGQANLIDVTDLDSTGKEFLLGLKDEGEITLGLLYAPTSATHAALRTAFSARTLKRFKIEFADTTLTQWEFTAYVSGFDVTMGVDQAVVANAKLKISGAISEAP